MSRKYLLGSALAIAVSASLNAAPANDVGSYFVQKTATYDQTNESTPTIDPNQPYQFFADIYPGQNGVLLTNSTLTTPKTNVIFFPADPYTPGGLAIQQQGFTNKAAMDAAYPSGTYIFGINTTSPNSYKAQLDLSPDAYPSAPQIIQITNAVWTNGYLQVLDVSLPVTLTWQNFQDSNGSVSIGVYGNSGFNSLSTNFPADGTQSNLIIPANFLTINANYQGNISFSVDPGSNSLTVPGANASSGYQTTTTFSIATGTNTQNSSQQGTNDVGDFGIVKFMNFDQSSAQSFTPEPYEPYQFTIFVNPGAVGTLLPSSTIATPPKSANVSFESGPNGLWFHDNFLSKSALSTTFPAGVYNFTLKTTASNSYSEGIKVGLDRYPAVLPKITKVANATWSGGYLKVTQASNPVTISWSRFKAINGMININIQGDNNGFSGFSTNFAADGSQSSYTIPGGSLPSNSVIQGTIGFQISIGGTPKIIPSGSYGLGYSVQNSFFLASGPSIPTSDNPYIIQKQHVLLQTSNGIPSGAKGDTMTADPGPFNFSIQSPVAGKVKSPNGILALNFTTRNSTAAYVYTSGSVTNLSRLNSLYKDGTYKFPDGQTVKLINGIYPNATNPPQILTVNSTPPSWNSQGQLMLDPTIDNTLTWTPYSGTNTIFNFATGGSEFFQIQNNNGGTVSIQQQAGVGSGTPLPFNTFTIPANTLSNNLTYVGTVSYFLSSSGSTNSPTHVAGYSTETVFTLVGSTPAP